MGTKANSMRFLSPLKKSVQPLNKTIGIEVVEINIEFVAKCVKWQTTSIMVVKQYFELKQRFEHLYIVAS